MWAKVEAQRAGADQSAEIDPHAIPEPTPTCWFGDIVISETNGKLRFKAVKSPKLRGEMLYYTGNTFIVRWDDRTMDADAFAVFSLDKDGKPAAVKDGGNITPDGFQL
ncbi:MAG: DUF3471 domain-containing protein [Marinilabiliales bacterium]|nr:DUF3471 domain-containing protein [Marinilabiliales bacterium]